MNISTFKKALPQPPRKIGGMFQSEKGGIEVSSG